MVDEQVRVLEQKPVAGVRIDDQLGVRQELRHREELNRRHHHVVAAVRNQYRLLDLSQLYAESPSPHATIRAHGWRSGRKNVRTSWTRSSGCSNAAK
jgi:hypothetical protein